MFYNEKYKKCEANASHDSAIVGYYGEQEERSIYTTTNTYFHIPLSCSLPDFAQKVNGGMLHMNNIAEFDLRGFREYCKENNFYRFILSAENQDDYTFDLGYTLTFYNIDICPETYKIYVYNLNTDNVMYVQHRMIFNLVKGIFVEEIDDSKFFCVIMLLCGSGSNAKRYKLIAQKQVDAS